MLKIRVFIFIFVVLWILAHVNSLNRSNFLIFKIFGISKIDVFNDNSLNLINWRIVYYKQNEKLPFLSENGENLRWLFDENFRYRTFFRAAKFLDIHFQKNKLIDIQKSHDLLRPIYFDYCLNELHQNKNITYKVLISNAKLNFSEIYYFDVSNVKFSKSQILRCEQVYNYRFLQPFLSL